MAEMADGNVERSFLSLERCEFDHDSLELLFEDDTDDDNLNPDHEQDDELIQEKDIDKKEGFLRTNVTEHSLSLLLERLSHAESNTIEHERSLAENVNKNASKESLKELLIAIAEMMAQCYDQLKSKNKRLRSIEIENNCKRTSKTCQFNRTERRNESGDKQN